MKGDIIIPDKTFQFDQNLLKDEERERKTAIALDVQYETFKRKQFLDKDRNGSDWIRHAISMIKREMDEFGSVSALAIENISNSNVQMKVIQELDNSRNMLRKSLKEAEEQLRKESEEAALRAQKEEREERKLHAKTRADVIMKYTQMDEAKIKELTLALSKLTEGAQRDQALLDKEVTETHSHELGLDKISIK